MNSANVKTRNLKAFILAAGFGTRLKKVSGETPKPLVPFMNQPVLYHILDQIKEVGIRDVCINIHYQKEAIKKALSNYTCHDLKINLSEEKTLLGTGGALSSQAASSWRKDSDLLVINGDIIHTFNLIEFISKHYEQDPLSTLAVNQTPQKGKTVLWSEGNFLRSFQKKTQENETPHSFACLQVISHELLKTFPINEKFSIISIYENLLEMGQKIHLYKSKAFWSDIGCPEDYFSAHRFFLEMMAQEKSLDHPAFKEKERSIAQGKAILEKPPR